MNCMKCGRDTQSEEVFCPTCLEDMHRHPVKVDTRVNIIPRKVRQRPDAPARQTGEDPEVLIPKLKRWIRRLCALVLILVLLLSAALGCLGWLLFSEDGPSMGQNYSTFLEDLTAP